MTALQARGHSYLTTSLQPEKQAISCPSTPTSASTSSEARKMATAARDASRKLQVGRSEATLFCLVLTDSDVSQALPSEARTAALLRVADALEREQQAILSANALDVTAAESENVAAPLLNRLRLKPSKIAQLAAGIRSIANNEEPLAELLWKLEIAEVCGQICCHMYVLQVRHVRYF